MVYIEISTYSKHIDIDYDTIRKGKLSDDSAKRNYIMYIAVGILRELLVKVPIESYVTSWRHERHQFVMPSNNNAVSNSLRLQIKK